MDDATHPDERCLVVMYHYVRDDLVRTLSTIEQRRSALKYGTQSASEKSSQSRDRLPLTGMVGSERAVEQIVSVDNAFAPLTSGIIGLTSAEFAGQVDWLCGQMEPVDWPAVSGWLKGGKTLPRRSVLFTFDDGLREHLSLVAPMLNGRKIKGVFFIPGVVLKQDRLLPAHAVHVLLSHLTDEQLLDHLMRELLDRGFDMRVFSEMDHQAAETIYHYEPQLRAHLKYFLNVVLDPPMRDAALSAVFEAHVGPLQDWSRRWYLSTDDICELHAMGNTIGGHGFSHEPLTRLSAADLVEDFRMCQSLLDEIIGRTARPFSYPFGRHDEGVRAACENVGFAEGFTTIPKWMDGTSVPFLRPRIDTAAVKEFLEAESIRGPLHN